MRLVQGKTLTDYLRKRVKSALEAQSIIASEWTEFYLVNLLNNFLKAEKLYEATRGNRGTKPLALLLLQAWDTKNEHKKIAELKQLGDQTLYILGVFEEHIASKKLVSTEYYESIGKGAYASLAGITDGKSVSDLYCELSENFRPLSQALGQAALTNENLSATQLLNIYKRWVETGDEKLLATLREYGLAASKGSEKQ